MISKKILASILIIGILALAIGWGTYAWFFDKETSTGNVFSAGKIDLAIWDGSEYKSPFSGVLVKLEDMLPSEWAYRTVWIKNVGTREGDAWLHLDITDWGLGIPWYIDFDLKVADTVVISASDGITLAHIRSCWIPLGGLAVNQALKIELSFHLKGETPNGYNGDSCMFNIDFYLNQPGAPPPPSNRILLENKDENWKPIIGDGKWGVAEYSASDLTLKVWAFGLTPNSKYQISINSPEKASWYPVDENTRRKMASALASGQYSATGGTAPPSGYNLYERGYYDISVGGNLFSGPPSPWQDDIIGVWTWTEYGQTNGTTVTDSNGYFSTVKTASLPSGEYSYIKLVVKEDVSPWTPVLMECWIPMFFTIP
jgi:predicted ribosomally synthesized peptide with SipW-like signal peptide